MPLYVYKALDSSGKVLTGVIESDEPKTARATLRSKGIHPISLREKPEEFHIFKRAGLKDIAIFTRQLATLLGAGLPVSQSLLATIEQLENRQLKKIITNIYKDVTEGNTLSNALYKHPKYFAEVYVSMVRAGESSGALDIVLSRLADFTENQINLRNRVSASLAYPLFMVIIGTCVLIFLLTYIVPTVTKIFDQLGQRLPLVTIILINVGDFMRRFWWVILAAIFFCVTFYKASRNTKNGRLFFDGVQLKLPLAGKLIRKLAVARFARTLATLLDGGISIVTALDIVKNVADNMVLSRAIEKAAKNIEEGENTANSLKRSGVFPPIAIHMIAIGEQSGNLEEMLLKVADSFDNEVESAVKGITSLLEPVMIVGMGCVVGFIVLAILLPIFEMNQMVR